MSCQNSFLDQTVRIHLNASSSPMRLSAATRRPGLRPLLCAFGTLIALSAVGTQTFAGTTVYKYDAQDRLIEVDYPDGSKVTYTFDAAGNRTQTVKTAA